MLGNIITVVVVGPLKMDHIISEIKTRFGISIVIEHPCYGKICSFDIEITNDMFPNSTLIVYYVKNENDIYHGKTFITTSSLTENFVSIIQSWHSGTGNLRKPAAFHLKWEVIDIW